MKRQSTPKLKKQATNILEKARRIMGITRDQYAFCQYVHYRCADPRQKVSGWCCDLKEEIGDFVGISRVGVHKMARAMEQSGLVSISIGGYYQVTETWIDIESDCKQSLHRDGKEDVNKVYTGRKQSLQIEREKRKQSLHTPYSIDNKELEGERTPPAPNPLTSKEEKKEKAPPVAPHPPADCDGSYGVGKIEFYPPAAEDEDAFAQWLPSLHTAMENNAPGSMPKPPSPLNLGFCGNCMGLGYRNGRNGRETCEDCEGSGHGDQMIADPQFEVTAIASPTDLPGVTLVEAAPPLKRANTILDAEKKILDWATGDGLATIAIRHGMSKRHVPDDLAPLVAHYVSVYASTNEGSRASLLRDPVAHFEGGLYKYLIMQNTIDRNNAPKDGGATRQNGQPHSALPRSLQNQVGK